MSEVQTGFKVDRDSAGNQLLIFEEARSRRLMALAIFLLGMFVVMPITCVSIVKTKNAGVEFLLIPLVAVLTGIIVKAVVKAKSEAVVKLTQSSLFTTQGGELLFSKITNFNVVVSEQWDTLTANYQGNLINITQNIDHGMGSALQSAIQAWIFNPKQN